MFKGTLVCLSLAGLFLAGAAIADDKVKIEPGKGPTEAMSEATPTMTPPAAAKTETGVSATGDVQTTCTQTDLTALIAKAGALTDMDKQKMTLGHLDLAKKSMDRKDMTGCAMHMKEANASLGIVTK